MSTSSPGASDAPTAPPASPAEATHSTATPPWVHAVNEHYNRNDSTPNLTELVRRACEQWARSATEHWRQHDADVCKLVAALGSERTALRAQLDLCHDAFARSDSQCAALQEQLYLCRTVLEQCRPMVKAHLLEMERFGPGDESIIGRIEQALKVGL